MVFWERQRFLSLIKTRLSNFKNKDFRFWIEEPGRLGNLPWRFEWRRGSLLHWQWWLRWAWLRPHWRCIRPNCRSYPPYTLGASVVHWETRVTCPYPRKFQIMQFRNFFFWKNCFRSANWWILRRQTWRLRLRRAHQTRQTGSLDQADFLPRYGHLPCWYASLREKKTLHAHGTPLHLLVSTGDNLFLCVGFG